MDKINIDWIKNKIDTYTDGEKVNLHSMIPDSEVNGPGKRLTIWFHGCPFACAGCFNPHTWDFKNKNIKTVLEVVNIINNYTGDGITFSGGEPMMQAKSFYNILQQIDIDRFPKGIICFTGMEMEEIKQVPLVQQCMDLIDVTVVGRFVESLKQDKNLAGSSNQQFVYSTLKNRGKSKVKEEEIVIDQDIEIHYDDTTDSIKVTGFPRIDKKVLKELGITIIE
jgi:anaerobic ribonucleoside-triphosphate reductase activating protein